MKITVKAGRPTPERGWHLTMHNLTTLASNKSISSESPALARRGRLLFLTYRSGSQNNWADTSSCRSDYQEQLKRSHFESSSVLKTDISVLLKFSDKSAANNGQGLVWHSDARRAQRDSVEEIQGGVAYSPQTDRSIVLVPFSALASTPALLGH